MPRWRVSALDASLPCTITLILLILSKPLTSIDIEIRVITSSNAGQSIAEGHSSRGDNSTAGHHFISRDRDQTCNQANKHYNLDVSISVLGLPRNVLFEVGFSSSSPEVRLLYIVSRFSNTSSRRTCFVWRVQAKPFARSCSIKTQTHFGWKYERTYLGSLNLFRVWASRLSLVYVLILFDM